MEIDRDSCNALELADGRRTVREIAALIYEKYPKRYSCVASAEKEMLSFFQNLYEAEMVELTNYG